MSDSGNVIFMSNKKKKLFFLAFFTTLLLVSTVVGIVLGVNTSKNSAADDIHFTTSHRVVKTACSSTFYPELCFSAITAEPGFANKVSTHKDAIELSVNITIRSVRRNEFTVNKIQARKGLTVRQKAVLRDCLETTQNTLSRLRLVIAYLKDYANHADDIRTYLSAAISNQETCRNGFSDSDTNGRLRRGLDGGQVLVERLCSNALAMFKDMTDRETFTRTTTSNRISNVMEMVEVDGGTWPAWMTAEDRRLLLSDTVEPDVVVAPDGSGHYTKVQDAVDAAPDSTPEKRFVIKLKQGAYRENVTVKRDNIMFLGETRTNTIITASKTNGENGDTTFSSGTVIVTGDGFLAREVSFENKAGPLKNQSVALRVDGDRSAFHRCAFLGYQDTLYVHNCRQFLTNCMIVGTVDFIFGYSSAYFQNCDIRPRLPREGQQNMVTAHGRSDENQNTGIVIQSSTITANNDLEPYVGSVKSYLGRPWGEHSRTVIMETEISNVIKPEGWHYWEYENENRLNTLFYAEYKNTGAGADTSKRVNWKGFKIMTTDSEAEPYTADNFIAGSSWVPTDLGVPYNPGL